MTTLIAYKISETTPPIYLLASNLSPVEFLTRMPNVPRIIKNTGKYAIKYKANSGPEINAKMHPPIALNNAKSKLAYYSPIDLWIV